MHPTFIWVENHFQTPFPSLPTLHWGTDRKMKSHSHLQWSITIDPFASFLVIIIHTTSWLTNTQPHTSYNRLYNIHPNPSLSPTVSVSAIQITKKVHTLSQQRLSWTFLQSVVAEGWIFNFHLLFKLRRVWGVEETERVDNIKGRSMQLGQRGRKKMGCSWTLNSFPPLLFFAKKSET